MKRSNEGTFHLETMNTCILKVLSFVEMYMVYKNTLHQREWSSGLRNPVLLVPTHILADIYLIRDQGSSNVYGHKTL